MDNKICCVTGHRNIEYSKINFVAKELRHKILTAIDDGYIHFISGFAEGTDLIFASIISELKTEYPITLEAAIPYLRRMKTADKNFQRLVGCCDMVKILSEEYSSQCFMIRNRYMVQQSSRVIAVYDGRESGGTFATIRYAKLLERDVKLIEI